MTEFKKVTALSLEVEEAANKLMVGNAVPKNDDDDSNSAAESTRKLQEVSEWYKVNSESLRQRTDKLLVKAREKDPDRQTYNATMCEKIEALGVEVARILSIVVKERLGAIEGDFLNDVRAEQAHQAAAEATAASLDALEKQEKERGMVLLDDEKSALKRILALESDAKTEVYRIEGDRAAATWAREQERRRVELERARKMTVDARQNAEQFVQQHVSSMLPQQDPRVKQFLLSRLAEIVDALCRDPEQEGLRTIRCDAEKFVRTFGHHCLVAAAPGEDQAGGSAAHVERELADEAEALLFSIGYEPAYTASPISPFWAEDGRSFRCDATGNEVRFQLLTTGKNQVEIPWIEYGDRRLVLQEPPVAESPDEWIAWHETLKAVNKALIGVL